MAKNAISADAVVTTPVADNVSANDVFIDAFITIHKQYTHSSQWNAVSLTNEHGDIQTITIEKYLHMVDHVKEGKKFVQTIQSPYRGVYQGKEANKPNIKIQGNVRFEKGYVLLEVLQSKDGSVTIASANDVYKRSYFKIREAVLLAYHEMFVNEKVANERLSKLALERSVNLSECLSL